MLSFKTCHFILFFLSLSLSATAETVRGAQSERHLQGTTREKVEQAYCRVLQRPGDSGGIDNWVANAITVKGLVKSFILSSEFKKNFVTGKSNAAQARTLFDVLLAREANDAGLDNWENNIKKSGWETAVDNIMKSDEYNNSFGNNAVPGGGRTPCRPPQVQVPQVKVDLGTAENYVILAKTGISTVTTSTITGDIGVSPITATAMTGFALTMDSDNEYSTSAQLTGKAYASTYDPPTPATLSIAVSAMEAAYTDAAGRIKGVDARLNLEGGLLSYTSGGPGFELTPGVYSFNTDVVKIVTDITFKGSANEVFIIQITGNLEQAANTQVNLAGGALAKNIFWQVAGNVLVGAGANMKGILLVKTHVLFVTGSSLNGRVLTQTACNLQKAIITQP
jgi:hypothetical protein